MNDPIVTLHNKIVCTYRQMNGCDHDCQNCYFLRLEDIEIINALEAASEAFKEKKDHTEKEKGLTAHVGLEDRMFLTINVCPKCKEAMSKKYPFCPHCGQPIDWSEVEE